MQTIKISNGDTLQFPDEMSDDQIQDAIHKEYGSSPSMPESPAPKKGKLERAADLADTYLTNPLREAEQGFQQSTANAGKGIANLGIHAANLIPGVNINTLPAYDFAPKTPNAFGGELASYFLGGGLAKAASKAGEASGLIRSAMNNSTICGAVEKAASFAAKHPRTASLAGSIAGQGLQGAIYNPDNQTLGAAVGAGGGILGSAVGSAAQVSNPFVRAAARTGLGAGLGAGVGYGAQGWEGAKKGAEYGAVGGFLVPTLLKKIGLAGERPGREAIGEVNLQEAKPIIEAAARLGRPLRPSEVTGNPYTASQEAQYGKTGEAAAEKTRIGMENVKKEKSAIDDLMDTIYDRSPESKKKIKDLYTSANKWSLKPEIINQFKDDPVIAEAFNRVQNDVAYQRKLKDIPENNVAYLNQVKRALGDMEGKALRAGEADRATEFSEARKDLVNTIDDAVPAYKNARMESQRSIIRSNLQKSMRSKEIKGSTFFNTNLMNDGKYNKLLSDLRHVPEAQQTVRDMKSSWKNLINIETPRSAAGKAEMRTASAREIVEKLSNLWDEMTGSTKNLEALKFINGGKWQDEIPKITGLPKRSDRIEKYSKILGKLVGATFTGLNQSSGE